MLLKVSLLRGLTSRRFQCEVKYTRFKIKERRRQKKVPSSEMNLLSVGIYIYSNILKSVFLYLKQTEYLIRSSIYSYSVSSVLCRLINFSRLLKLLTTQTYYEQLVMVLKCTQISLPLKYNCDHYVCYKHNYMPFRNYVLLYKTKD